MSDQYTGILIRVRRWDEAAEAYPVEVELDDGHFFRDGLLRLDRQALLTAESDPQEYGLELFYALFSGPVRRAYDTATGQAAARTEGRLRVRLWIDDDAAELHALPWERVYHVYRGQPVPLATSSSTPFSRYTGLEIAEPQPITAPCIRFLVAISNPLDLPSGLSPIPVEQEVENLRQALGDLCRRRPIQVTFMPGQTGLSPELRQQLEGEGYQVHDGVTGLDDVFRLLPGCHVLHFLGHGHFRPQGERGEGVTRLFLERVDGRWEAVEDEDLVTRLTAIDPLPHLVFLSACETARRDPEAVHPFIGLGPKLVKAGVPAVVAMQDVVPMPLARQLTGDFYQGLLEHGVVDQALNQARLLLFEREEVDWAIPVLFMRLKEGQLFAADPVRLALQAIRAHVPYHPWPENEYLPIEVVHLVGRQESGSLERVQQEAAPSLDLIEATLSIFSRRHLPPGASGMEPAPAAGGGPQGPQDGRLLVALVGDRGTARSTQMRRIAWITADRSLQPGAERQILPIYVDLVGFQRYPSGGAGLEAALETMILEGLRQFWPDLTPERLSDLLRQEDGPTMRFLLDGSEDLPERERRAAWRAIGDLVRRYPRHEYMVAVDIGHFDPRQLDATDVLVIQPLSQRKIEEFLKGLTGPTGRRLYGALARAQLFDLAASPWLLIRMLDQAREGIYPHSRTAVLQGLIEGAIADVPTEHGMRARAERSLYALAWDMQSARQSTWPVENAFRTMATVRGNREYSLEDLYDALVESGLLTRVGQECLRFTYPAIRAYCCARAILDMGGRDQVVDDVAATLGRLTRLRWWEDTLVLLSGLIRNPNVLVRPLLYGAALSEGEQTFLAARCLLEAASQRIEADLIDQVVDGLVWRLDSANERLVSRRVRAAQALGQLGQSRLVSSASVLPYLVRVATQRTRTNWRGDPAYAYSSVRLAAAVALQRMKPFALGEIQASDTQLARLMSLWSDGNVDALATILQSGDLTYQTIAAFALGDLQTEKAVDHLVAAFLRPGVETETRWALTDALAQLDPTLVTQRAVLPLLDAQAAKREGLDPHTWRNRAAWYDRLAYLIGKLRAQGPIPRAFLDRCLYEFTNVWVKSKAIQSLGWMYDRSYKNLFEQIAAGDFSRIALSERLSEEETMYLRRKAIQALAYIGDKDTLTNLRAGRTDWSPELERVFYWTSEEIYWRLGLTSAQ